jgi:gliding motility-associated-like protein
LQNGLIAGNTGTQGGQLTMNIKGSYVQTGGRVDSSWAAITFNVDSNFTVAAGYIGSRTRALQTIAFTGSGTQNLDITGSGNFIGDRISLTINKTSGALSVNNNINALHINWIKGDLNLGTIVINGLGFLNLLGSGTLGSINATGAGELRTRWLNATSGILNNANDKLLINGGSGGAIQARNTQSWVSDYLRFRLNAKQIANNNFSINGNWNGPSTVTLNNHGLQDGDMVTITGITNNGGAFNGTYTITRTGNNTFTLNNTTFPGNWSSSNTGTITRTDNFEAALGSSTAFQGISFNKLQNDNADKVFRLHFKSTGANENNGSLIQQVGQVPGILGRNWMVQRVSGTGVIEALESVALFVPNAGINNRIGQSNSNNGVSGYESRGGVLASGGRIVSTKTIQIATFDFMGTWFAIGNAVQLTVPPGGFNIPGNYPNLTAVAAEYNDVTFSGPVTFNFGVGYNGREDGPTPERFPIVFNRKQNHPVTIRATAANRETSNSNLATGANSALIVFDGVSNITFDGAHNGGNWRFVQYGIGDSANVFRLVNGATNINIRNNDIQASATQNSYTGAILIGRSSAPIGNSNNTIANNTIRNNQANRKPLFIKRIIQTERPGYIDGALIINASQTTPVVCTTSVNHLFSNGQRVRIRNLDPSGASYAIAGVTGNGVNPIRITSANPHGLTTGSRVVVGAVPGIGSSVNVQGNTAANGTWTITVIDNNTFSLNGSTANGNFIPPAPGQPSPTWRCLDPIILNGDYYLGNITDTTFTLYLNSSLTIGYGPKGRFSQGRGDMSGSYGTVVPIISNVSNTTPVVITTSANHFLQTGNTVRLSDSLGVGTTRTWIITRINATQFSLNTSTAADFPAGRWQFEDVPLVVVTSVSHPLATGNLIDINGVEFPPNANGNFVTTVINDTTFSLNGTSYYQTPYYGPARMRNLITTAEMNIGYLNNTTPVKTGTGTSDGWLSNHWVEITGETNGILTPGTYRMWIGRDNSREIIIRHTRKINPPYRGNPVATFDQGISRGIVANNPGTALNVNNVIENNNFENIIKEGLGVTSAGNGSRWRINNNHYYLRGVPGPRSGGGRDFIAFNFSPGIKSNNNEIIGNNVGGTAPFCGGAPLSFGLSSGQYTQVMLTAFLVDVGDQQPTIIRRNRVSNINGVGPGDRVRQNANQSSGSLHINITPNAGIVGGIDHRGGLAIIGGDSYDEANWHGDTLARDDFSIDMYGESGQTFAIRTNTSSNTVISKNIIGNVKSRARAYSGNGSFSCIIGEGTGSPQVSKNLMRNIVGVPTNAIIMRATGQQILLDSNNMADFVVSGNGLYGIFVDANGSGGTIKGNRFYRSQCLPFNGVGNNMSALEITGAPGGAGWTVVNNQFSFDFRRWRGRFDPSFAGIRHNTSGGVPVRYFFNTVYMSGPLGDPGWSTSCFRKDGNGSLIFRNNMLVNESGGGSGAHYAINIDNTTNWNGNNVTNNLYYAYGGNSFLARFNTTQITDINVWEGFAGGTNNMESPVFWKYEQPDYLGRLQLSGENCPIKDKGINVGIFDDYDSLLVRDRVTPDIGSHEFSNELPIGAFWVGGVNNDWHLEANWCDQKVPQAFEDVTISNLPRRRNMPIVSTDNAVCRNLRILDNPGSMLTIWGDRANLIVYGDSGRMQWKHSNFANITGAMTFGSDSLQSIPAPPTDLGYNRRNLVLNPIAVTTVSITAAGATITTAGNHNLNYGEFVRISRIDGVPSLNGSFKIFRTPSANTIEIRGSFSGTYTGNRGMVTPLAVLPIRAMIVGANSITVQVSRNHGLSNGQNVSLVGVKGIDAANGAFAISNVNNDRFDIPVKTFSTFANDTNAFMIPSLTGYYDLRLTGSNIKVAEGAIEAASVMATGATFITNRNSLELRDSLVARNGGRIIIEDPTTTTVGSHFTRNGVGNGAINALSNSLFGLMSADSGRIDFAGTDLVVCDTIRVRRSGVININAGRIFSKNVHAFRGQLNQNNAEVTATQKIIASANGRYSISGNGFAASRDSIWVKRNGLIQTEAGSTADLLALNTSAMLGGNILLSGSGNLYTGGLFFRAGLITTGGQNRVILPSSNNINLNTIGEGNDSSFVNGRLAHQHGRLLASLPLTNIQATANGPFTLRTGSNHNFATGDVVLVQGLTAAGGNRANGAYIIDVLDNTNFRLRGSVAQGAINAASPGGTVTRLQSRFYPIGKQTEYRPMNVHLDQGTVGETALSLPLVSFSNNNGVAILTTAGNHNFRNRQPVTLVNSGLSNVNPVYYIRVESPNSFRLFNDFLLSANPGISGTLSAGATVIGHAEYVAEAFLTKPDSLIMPPATPSWFGNWTDQVIGVHQSRFTRFTQISHLSTPFRINGGAVRLSYRQSEINPSFHNNRYLTIVKDSLWPTPPHNRWLNRVGNSVDSIAPLKTIHSVKPFTTPGVFTLGFLNILPCNHEANAGRDTTFCHNVLDSLGTRGLPGFTYRWRRIDPWQGGSFLSDTTRARLGVRAINTTNQAYKVRFELTMARSVDCQKKDTVEITVLPGLIKPIIFPPGPLTFCPNPVNTVFSTVGGYDKYYWQIIPAWAGEIIGDSNQVEVDWNDGLVGVVKVVVRLENKCGLTPLSDTVRVDIGGGAPKPATPTTASTTLCTNPPDFMVNVSPVQGATNYEWRVFPSAAAVISGNTNSINVNPDNTFNGVLRFIVRVTTDCGTSIFSDTLRVTIAPGSPAPQKPFTANPNVCFGTQSSLVNTVKIAGANSYQWVVNPSVAATSIAGDTHVVTINWNQVFTGTVWVKVRVNGSCGVSPSSDSLQFTILPQKIETVDVTACNSYTWNGQTYTQSGAYTFTTQTAQGCDSTITLNLTIAPTVTAGVDVTACNSYTWNGQTYTQSGTYTFTTQTAQGCDSTITLNLTIAPTVTASVDVTACNSYTWNGQTYTQSGIYTFTTQTAQGCDSTITLNLTIAPSINTSMDITACNSYTWNGQIYTQSGTYTFTTQTAQGCDSTITLNLTIAPSINTSMDITACNSYIWNGQTYTQSGTYTFTTQTAQGCDSTITLNLTIAPTVTASVDVTACNSYTWNGQTYTQSGAYTFTTQTAQGCDSTITLNLTIAPSITASVDVTACNSYTWNGQTYTQSGIYTYTTQTAQGCDSTITLNLTISPSINTSVDVTACNSYTWNGQTYTQSGAYTFTTQTAQGCDSTITLNLTIAPSITASVDVTACNSYTWNGQTYTQSGAYTFTTQTAQGCDSTITLNLTIAPTVTASVDVTTCNSYTWNGQTYTQSGTYTFTTQTAQGCDSTITLNLTIAPSITASVDVTTCNSYTWNGQTYTQSGAYTFTTQTAQGCDSTITLNLTIAPAVTASMDVTACNSYTWNGQTYTQSGAYTFSTQTAQGCDSTITLNLTISPSLTANVDVTACNSYTWNGQTYTQSGAYTFTTQTAQGCDSTITLNLTIAPSINTSMDVTACNSYTWNGQTYTQSGAYTFTTQTAQGCDSTITLNLTITPAVTGSVDVTACNSYTWNGQTYTQSGTYTFTTQTAQGCDSTITLNLTIAPSINTSMDVTACNSYTWNGQTYTQSGAYTFTTQTAQGCDSTITLNLTIAPTVTASVDVTTCNSYTWNGQTYTQSGTYTFTTQTAQGCDSTITLNLTIAPSITASVDVTACNSYTWNGQTYTQSGAYTFTTQTAQGCDSTITLNLTIAPSINTSMDITACNSYTWNGQTYTQSGTYTFTTQTAQGCDSTITLNLTIAPSINTSMDITACNSYTWNGQIYTQSGTYTFTTQTAQGCDSTITLNLTIAPSINTSMDITACNSYTWNGQTYTQSGAYTFTTQTAQGCDSTITLNLTISPSINTSVDVTACNSYTWNGQTYTQSGAYTFTTQTAQGCDSTITLNLTIAPSINASVDVTTCNSYTWNGQTYTQSGAYTFTTQTAQGCDSTITLNLTIAPSVTASVDVTACNSYTWNGQTYTQSGAYTFTTQTAQGCDSTITLNLTIAPSINASVDVTTCNSYTWNGQTYTQSGTYTFTTQTAQGCDSTITLNLTIAPSINTSVDVTTCNSYTWNGQTYTQSGAYTFTTQTAQGCDSTITLNLTIAPGINTSVDVTTCNSYTWNGQTYTQSGAYTFTTQTAQGCDSTITLNLIVTPLQPATILGLDTNYCQQNQVITLMAEPTGGVFKVNGNVTSSISLNTPGVFVVRYLPQGCFDSTQLQVRVQPRITPQFVNSDTLYCVSNQAYTLSASPSGGTFIGLFVSGNQFTTPQAGNFTIRYFVGGCSDTASYTFNVSNAPQVVIAAPTDRLCASNTVFPLTLLPSGGTLLINGLPEDNFIPSQPGNYQLIYRYSVLGCIGSDTLNVSVDTRPQIVFNPLPTPLCSIDTIITLTGFPVNGRFNGPGISGLNRFNPRSAGAGTHTLYHIATNGVCTDSVGRTITVLQAPVVNAGGNDTLCQGSELVQLTGQTPANGFWSGPGVSTDGFFNPDRSGTFILVYRVPDDAGCKGRDLKTIVVKPGIRISWARPDTVLCEGQVVRLNPLIANPTSIRWQDGSNVPVYLADRVGSYYVEVKDKHCTYLSDTFRVREVQAVPEFSIGRDTAVCFTKPFRIKAPSGFRRYEWRDMEEDTIISRDTTIALRGPSTIKLTVFPNRGNCPTSREIDVEELNCEELFVPEAFSPNADGVNDVWRVWGQNVNFISIKVYNEWGECVFATFSRDQPWDGRYKGALCPAGGYKYFIEYEGATPRGRNFKGKTSGTVFLIK